MPESRMPFGSKVGSFQLKILEILKDRPLHGYGIIDEMEIRTGHRPTSAALYPALQKLENYGLIESTTQKEKKRDRRVYSLTKKGTTELTNVLGLMVEFCITGIQGEFENVQKNVYRELRVKTGATILYPSAMYRSLKDLAMFFKMKARIVAIVPSGGQKLEKSLAEDRLDQFVTVKEGELEKLPLKDSSVDVAIYPFALCRCSPWATINLGKSVREAARVLRPGGVLVILDLESSDHAMLRILSKSVELCGFGQSETRELLEANGFTGVSVEGHKGILVAQATRAG